LAQRAFHCTKLFILLIFAISHFFTACAEKSIYKENNMPVQSVSGKTAMEYFRDEKIFSGFNIGNTLDAFSGRKAKETAWGNPPVSQELMDGIKAAGFDIVRIPVTWSGWFGDAPDYLIDEALLIRVAEVVDMAGNAGLKAIINLHHDGAEGVDHINWLSMNTANGSKEGYKKVTDQFTNIWKQIALYFKNYGDWLMFESCNEIHDGNWGNTNFVLLLPQIEILNKWNQIFTDIVRKSGGNNKSRFLVIPGYNTSIRYTIGDFFKLPEDSVPNKQVVTFHYYDPYQFGIEGSRSSWGTEADKKKVDDDFSSMIKFTNSGIPVIMGECGAVLQVWDDDFEREEQARHSREDYIFHVFGTAKKYGIIPIYWDNGATRGNGEKFGLLDRRTGQPNSTDSEDLIKLMISAVR